MISFYKRIPNPVFRKYNIESTQKFVQKIIDNNNINNNNNDNLKIINKLPSSIPFIIIFSLFTSHLFFKYFKYK